MKLTDTLAVHEDGWRLTETGWDDDRAVAVGSNFLCGNGYLGYRGTTPEQRSGDYVALVVTDTYDCADGHWRELTTAPNPLFVSASVQGVDLGAATGEQIETSLHLATGTFAARWTVPLEATTATITVERFASMDDLHLLAQRWTLVADAELTIQVDVGIDGDIWSLNGEHLPTIDFATTDDRSVEVVSAVGETVESGITVAAASSTVVAGGEVLSIDAEAVGGNRSVRRHSVRLGAGDTLQVDTVAAVMSSNDRPDPLRGVEDSASTGAARGFDELQRASTQAWAEIWKRVDVAIDGDLVSQAALRFSAYHNRISTPAHADHLPIGARGLSCQAYQGAAFWDQEIYNLPAYLFTEPEIARQLLVYRHRTLDGARRKAARLGYDGAYYAWVSGVTGDELCPDIFFEDVLTGRPIRNHFNVWQMHVSPDIVTTIDAYVSATGDVEFLVEHGAEIAFEVARFLRSFVRYNDWTGTYHCIRLLGPDEWHENVDDNAFTNHQSHAALSFAIDTWDRLTADHPEVLTPLMAQLDLTADEVDRWRHVRDHLQLPVPDAATGLIEQFREFFTLEDTTPDVVATRLLHSDEYWGWPNGVAVATQVSKQADVAMLLWLQRDRFDADVLAVNYDYYEPRCSHASSLSHAAYGMIALQIGRVEPALAHFRATATVDLLNTNHAVVGGTFIGGIHTAACGGTYQLAVQGFGGLSVASDVLRLDPVLPAEWRELRFPVVWRGRRLSVRVSHEAIVVTADGDNPDVASVVVRGVEQAVLPGATVTVPVAARLNR